MAEHEHRWIDISLSCEAKERRMCVECGQEETRDFGSAEWKSCPNQVGGVHRWETTHIDYKTKLPMVCPHCGETWEPDPPA